MTRRHLSRFILCLIIGWSLSLTRLSGAQQSCTGCPYEYGPLGTMSFDSATYEQYGKPPSGNQGADLWLTTWASDGSVYGAWGDGKGWNQVIPYSYLGLTRITDDPPVMAASDVFGDGGTGTERKPTGLIADAGGVMRGFYNQGSDTRDGNYYMESTNQGLAWTFTGTKIFSVGIDDLAVYGIAQAGQAYTGTLPGDVSDSYYYIYLGIARDYPNHPVALSDIYLARVPKAGMATKANYEYFSGTPASPAWSSNIANKASIFHDPNSYEYTISVTYWPQLDKWILVKGHQISKLGIFESDTPWIH